MISHVETITILAPGTEMSSKRAVKAVCVTKLIEDV